MQGICICICNPPAPLAGYNSTSCSDAFITILQWTSYHHNSRQMSFFPRFSSWGVIINHFVSGYSDLVSSLIVFFLSHFAACANRKGSWHRRPVRLHWQVQHWIRSKIQWHSGQVRISNTVWSQESIIEYLICNIGVTIVVHTVLITHFPPPLFFY